MTWDACRSPPEAKLNLWRRPGPLRYFSDLLSFYLLFFIYFYSKHKSSRGQLNKRMFNDGKSVTCFTVFKNNQSGAQQLTNSAFLKKMLDINMSSCFSRSEFVGVSSSQTVIFILVGDTAYHDWRAANIWMRVQRVTCVCFLVMLEHSCVVFWQFEVRTLLFFLRTFKKAACLVAAPAESRFTFQLQLFCLSSRQKDVETVLSCGCAAAERLHGASTSSSLLKELFPQQPFHQDLCWRETQDRVRFCSIAHFQMSDFFKTTMFLFKWQNNNCLFCLHKRQKKKVRKRKYEEWNPSPIRILSGFFFDEGKMKRRGRGAEKEGRGEGERQEVEERDKD